jgi:hypothetical protein
LPALNLRGTILAEHSKKQCNKIVAWVGSDRKRFGELMQLMLHDEYRVAQRVAYPISYCVRNHPSLLLPWFAKMIKRMQDKDVHVAVRRNALRIFEDIDIPKKYCGVLYELSDQYLHDLTQAVAVRAFALTVMLNISRKYPELQNEVRINAESLTQCGIPALESRSRQALSELAKNNPALRTQGGVTKIKIN